MSDGDDDSSGDDTGPASSHFGVWLFAVVIAFVLGFGLLLANIGRGFADACC